VKKLKIYLDTSIISHLQANDVPERMALTKIFWEELKTDSFDVVVSELTLDELEECHEPKRTYLYEQLADINFLEVNITNEIRELAKKYIAENIFPIKYEDDALHISCASINGCNAVLSWNFKHMVKLKTILAVNGINKYMGYSEIEILTPESIIETEED